VPEFLDVSNNVVDLEQAAELALLVELEAAWENLRLPASRRVDTLSTTRALNARQKAYDTFRAKLTDYNKRYRPVHIPELLLNTPARLGTWCRAMRDLYVRVEHDPKGHCPVQLLEKAHRRADILAGRLTRDSLRRPETPDSVRAVVQVLDALSKWCDSQSGIARAV
jgi:hypothetical protein